MKIVCDSETKRKDLIRAIRHIMLDSSLKVNDISSRIGQTKGSTSNLLNPDYRPDGSMTIDTLAMLCNALDCTLTIDISPMPEAPDGDAIS